MATKKEHGKRIVDSDARQKHVGALDKNEIYAMVSFGHFKNEDENNTTFFFYTFSGMIDAARLINPDIKVEWHGPMRWDPVPEISAIKKLTARRVDGIMVTAADKTALDKCINAAIGAGIPVINFDADSPASARLTFVGTDNYEAGYLAGQTMAAWLNGQGDVAVSIVPTADHLIARLEGFKEAIRQTAPKINVHVFHDSTETELGYNQENFINVLKNHPEINGLFATYNRTGIGAAEAVEYLGLQGKIQILAFDYDDFTVKMVATDKLRATVGQDPYMMGYVSMILLHAARHAAQMPVKADGAWRAPALVDFLNTHPKILKNTAAKLQYIIDQLEQAQDPSAAIETEARILGKVELLDIVAKNYEDMQNSVVEKIKSLKQEVAIRKQAEIELRRLNDELEQRVEERTAQIARQAHILDAFMDNIPDNIYFKDLDSRITRVNRAHAIHVGLNDPTAEIGKSDFDFFPEEQARPKFEQEQEIIRTGQPILNLEEPDGIGRWSMTTKMPLRDEKGVIIGIFGISSDITELVKARQAAEAAVQEANKARALAEIEKEKAEAAKNEAEKAHYEMEAANQTLAAQMWQTDGQALLNEKMRGEQDIPTLANNVIDLLCDYLDAQIGALYIMEKDVLKVAGTYAYKRKNLAKKFRLGEGLVGQAALKKRLITVHIPEDYIPIDLSSLGKIVAKHVLFAPFAYEEQTIGVLEMGKLAEFTPAQMSFLEKAVESVAIAFMTAQARARVNELFFQTRQQAEELQAQEEELRATNEELEAQTESLRASETRLKANKSALEAANVNLEEKTHILQEQQAALDRQNQVLREAQQELERKAEELTVANKYKSEFLANMSHELRTPLNSLLILSRILANNESGNLNPDQVKSAEFINSCGIDLLDLINEILDLSKVEAGRMTFNFAPMLLENLAQSMRSQFEHMAEQKSLKFEVGLAAGLPESITTDQQRVEQVIKNLLSNAFKFTEQGVVQLIIEPYDEMIAIRVRDTGIGITPDQQERVFEAFQQADGSTSRKYGGTGLGLTISREMAVKLGGKIGLESKPGKGSEFTLYLPLHGPEGESPRSTGGTESSRETAPVSVTATPAEERSAPSAKKLSAIPITISKSAPPPAADDREKIKKGDRVLLVIEDDAKFAKVLFDYAHKKDFKCILAGDGESGLKLAAAYPPDAILLDLKLPGLSGWYVLDTLKGDPNLRHIPVHILSDSEQTMDAYQRGALGFLRKPISQEGLDGVFATIGEFLSRDIRSLLIVEDDNVLRFSVRRLLGGSDVKISEAASGEATLALLREAHFDCMILDLNLSDMTGFELLGKINHDKTVSKCPVIVYTGQVLTEEENAELLKYASSVIIKDVKSPERLLDETALFLHRVVADMPPEKQDIIRRLHDRDAVFSGKHVLVVDDNMRNAFALSHLLNDKNLQATIASSGEKALEMLDTVPDIDLVLMDIMMPGMDGYETMQKIRAQHKFKNLPMLALTAKAMKGDLEKCIAAGANDYLSKPIDPDRLFSMLRVWLYR